MKANDIKKIANATWGDFKITPKSDDEVVDGVIVPALESPLVFTGRNLWDEEWENGYIKPDGTISSYSARIVTKNFIKISPNKTYYVKCPNSGRLCFYDNNTNYISYIELTNREFTTPANAEFIKFSPFDTYHSGQASPMKYFNDICINESDASFNGKYAPYIKHTYSPTTPLVLHKLNNVADSFRNRNGKVNRINGTTETAQSILLSKNITKCVDKNGNEATIVDLTDRREYLGKASPTISGEKIITKGFTSGGEHFTQLYIYDDGEIWYVNGTSSAQAYASGVWEIEYKQIMFDKGVELLESERNALLGIYDLI